MNKKIVSLVPPLLTDSHIKEKIICIRGHRERMFNTSYEFKNGKHLFHNYGQGGAGWTFLFGCVHESIRQFQNAKLPQQPITVIGAGCYGLLTAILLKRAGHNVTIIAKDTHSIPSYKAAGFFFPRPRKVSNEQEASIFLARGIESFQTYCAILNGNHPFIKSGPALLPTYYAPDLNPGFTPYIQGELMRPYQEVMIDFGNGKSYQAHEYQALFINAAVMMKELTQVRDQLDIPLIIQEIHTFDEITDSIIFNCTNLGAKTLTPDSKMIPVQGHLISLAHQPIEQLQYMMNYRVTMTNPNGSKRDELIYFAPKEEGILGITFLRGQDSLNSNHHEFDRLLKRSRDFFGT